MRRAHLTLRLSRIYGAAKNLFSLIVKNRGKRAGAMRYLCSKMGTIDKNSPPNVLPLRLASLSKPAQIFEAVPHFVPANRRNAQTRDPAAFRPSTAGQSPP